MKMPILRASVSALVLFAAPALAQDHSPIDHSKMDHGASSPTHSSNVGPCGSDMIGASEEDGNQVDYIVPRQCVAVDG